MLLKRVLGAVFAHAAGAASPTADSLQNTVHVLCATPTLMSEHIGA